MQICGSDQWGNGVTGLELIDKMLDKNDAYVMTSPLILDSAGKKFGKSAGNALWLSPEKNTPYTVYQYFMNVADSDVGRFLKIYLFLGFDQIDDILQKHHLAPEHRLGQKELAYRVCQIIFGSEAAESAKEVSEFMFSDRKLELLQTADNLTKQAIVKEVGGISIGASDGKTIVDLLVESELCDSRGDAKKMLEQ